jgi:hypothetical protein
MISSGIEAEECFTSQRDGVHAAATTARPSAPPYKSTAELM